MSEELKFKLKNSKPDKDFIDWNESMSHNFDQDIYYKGSHPFIVWVEDLRLKTISNLIKNHMKKNNVSNPQILEAGCGAGHVLEEIANKINPCNLTGLDPLPEWLKQAEKRLGDKAKLIHGFAENLPFQDKSFDYVICTEVLEHVIDPKAVLKELKRVVKKNGLVIISVPNEKLISNLKNILDSIKIYNKLFPNIVKHNDWHIHCFDLNSFKKHIPPDIQISSTIHIPAIILPLRYILTFSG